MHVTINPGKFCDQKLELRINQQNHYRIVISNHSAHPEPETVRGDIALM